MIANRLTIYQHAYSQQKTQQGNISNRKEHTLTSVRAGDWYIILQSPSANSTLYNGICIRNNDFYLRYVMPVIKDFIYLSFNIAIKLNLFTK